MLKTLENEQARELVRQMITERLLMIEAQIANAAFSTSFYAIVPAENAIGLYSVELVREGSLVFSIVLDLILMTLK
jgi:hypothetical protein